jgi:hypothetical protein
MQQDAKIPYLQGYAKKVTTKTCGTEKIKLILFPWEWKQYAPPKHHSNLSVSYYLIRTRYLLRILFHPEHGINMLFRNVDVLPESAAGYFGDSLF